jgi:hypothetical protein
LQQIVVRSKLVPHLAPSALQNTTNSFELKKSSLTVLFMQAAKLFLDLKRSKVEI